MVLDKYRQGIMSADEEVSEQIYLTVISDANIYRQRLQPIFLNLARKKMRGIYQKELAVKLFTYAVMDGVEVFRKSVSDWRDYIPVRISGKIKMYTGAKLLEYYEEEIGETVERIKEVAKAKKELTVSQRKISKSLQGRK